MAQHDKDTEEFMRETVDPTAGRDRADLARDVLAMTRSAKSVKRNPVAAVTKAIIRGELGDTLRKESGMKPLQVFRLLNRDYGRRWWDWAPETVWQTFRADHDIEPGEDLKNLIGALQTIVNTNFAEEEWHIFEKVGHALCGNNVQFDYLQPLGLDEASAARAIILAIKPKAIFEPEVDTYVGALAKTEGVVFLPTELFGNAQTYLDGFNNALDLKEAMERRWPRGPESGDSLAMKTQLLILKEVADFVKEKTGA